MTDTHDDEDVPECLACGTCCFSTLRRYVPVTGNDHARLGDAGAPLVTWDENRAYMRLEDGHCSALRLDEAAGHFACTVYESRPQVCRDLARTSSACAGERSTKGERPLLALRTKRAH